MILLRLVCSLQLVVLRLLCCLIWTAHSSVVCQQQQELWLCFLALAVRGRLLTWAFSALDAQPVSEAICYTLWLSQKQRKP